MDITERGPHWAKMQPRWERSSSLLGGTEMMREKAETFLRAFPAESVANYERRLSMATLTNFYRKAAYSMIGNIFREDMIIESGLPDDILDDIDRRCTDVQLFAQNLAFSLITSGVQGVMVDHPKNPGNLTLEEELQGGFRHYAYQPKPDAIIAVYERMIQGVREPVYVSWYETELVMLPDGRFETRKNIQVRRRDDETGKVMYEVWKTESSQMGASNFEKAEEGELTYKRVPFVIGYSNSLEREDCYCGRPLLDDIAFKNIQHWQFSSSQDNILELTAHPERVLKTDDWEGFKTKNVSNENEQKKPALPIGPHMMRVLGKEDDLSFIVAPMEGVEQRAKNLDRIIAEAQMMALELILDKAPQTATARVLDRLEAMSPLQRVAVEVERVLNEMLRHIAEWRGSGEDPGYVRINKDFGVSADDALQAQVLKDALALGAITPRTYLEGVKKLASTLADIDVDKEITEIEAGRQMSPTLGDNQGVQNNTDNIQ